MKGVPTKPMQHECHNCHKIFSNHSIRGHWCKEPECQKARREHWLAYGRQYDKTYKRKVSAEKKANLGKRNTKQRRYCQNCGAVLKNRYFNCLECATQLSKETAGDEYIYLFNNTRKLLSEWEITPIGVANNQFKAPN